MTTIHAQAERKRQDRSVCRAEKRLCRARMLRVRGLIHPTSAVCATTDTARGEKRLPSEQNQAILKSSGRPLGECRIKVPAARRNEVTKLLALVNEQLWIGHFDIWQAEGVVMYRNTLLLAGQAEASSEQIEALIETAVDTCERHRLAFDFVVRGGRNAKEALDHALLETVGEA